MVTRGIKSSTEVLVIGAGPGGYVAAIRAAQLGKKVTLVEKEESLGGICLNHGCIPSKALIHVAGLAHKIKGLGAMGINVEEVRVDFKRLQAWKESVVKKLTNGVAFLCKNNGVNVIQGEAALVSPNEASVKTEHAVGNIEFRSAIIATGSKPIELPGFKFDEERVLSSRQVLALPEVPERFVIIGGGYIGLELGTVYAKLGSQVTIVEMMDQLLPGTDLDLVRVVARRLKSLGVEVHLNTKAKGAERRGAGVKVKAESKSKGELSFEAAKVLVTVGREPLTEGLGLKRAGVELDDKGFIKVDDSLRTTASGIYAIGDVVGGPLLAHKASREGKRVAEVIAGLPSAKNWRAMPTVIFTDPEIATVGFTESEAKEQGYRPIVGRFPFTASGRALAAGESEGFVKVVADEKTEQILGAHTVGPEASNLIGEAALAIEMGATLEDLALTVHPHPTLPESLMEAAEAALKQAIHILNR